jgi:hypothetical protein
VGAEYSAHCGSSAIARDYGGAGERGEDGVGNYSCNIFLYNSEFVNSSPNS